MLGTREKSFIYIYTLGFETLGIPRVWGNTLGIPLLPGNTLCIPGIPWVFLFSGVEPSLDQFSIICGETTTFGSLLSGEEPFPIVLGDETLMNLRLFWWFLTVFFPFFSGKNGKCKIATSKPCRSREIPHANPWKKKEYTVECIYLQ